MSFVTTCRPVSLEWKEKPAGSSGGVERLRTRIIAHGYDRPMVPAYDCTRPNAMRFEMRGLAEPNTGPLPRLTTRGQGLAWYPGEPRPGAGEDSTSSCSSSVIARPCRRPTAADAAAKAKGGQGRGMRDELDAKDD